MELNVQNLRKVFQSDRGPVHAVRGISFSVPTGKFFTLLGPSGCGKTTTLRCIAGLELPDGGEVQMGDRIFYSQEKRISLMPEERDIGMVFQSYAIWPHMSVFDNVAFPVRFGPKRLGRAEMREKVLWALKMVHMDEIESRMATQLSGGQQQRVALARALVPEPKLLLLDEPLSNLDAKLRENMRVEIRRIQQSLGLTTVYVTHDQAEALSMSDQIALFREGEIIQVGAPRDLYERPVNSFASGFIGMTNKIPGTVKQVAPPGTLGSVLIDGSEVLCVIGEGCQKKGSVVVSVRPEDIHVEPVNEAGSNSWTGIVKQVVYLGESLTCEIETKGLTLRARLHPSLRIKEGQRVLLSLQSERCIALPPDSTS